jgi:hypothetical protein
MLRILFGLFLVAHGLIHVSYLAPTPPDAGSGWPFNLGRPALLGALGQPALQMVGVGLALIAIAGLVAAGLGWLGLFGANGWWAPVAIAGSVASVLLLVIFFHPWIVLGIAIDLILIWALGVAGWPEPEF